MYFEVDTKVKNKNELLNLKLIKSIALIVTSAAVKPIVLANALEKASFAFGSLVRACAWSGDILTENEPATVFLAGAVPWLCSDSTEPLMVSYRKRGKHIRKSSKMQIRRKWSVNSFQRFHKV